MVKSEDTKRIELVILESIRSEEKQTGYELHASTVTYKKFAEENLNSSYHDVADRQELLSLLEKLVDIAVHENHFFILHFEVHGYDGGFQLKNGDQIEWRELLPLFQKLNVHYADMLMIILAVCKGASLLQFLDPTERSPFRALVSSARKMVEPDIVNGFEAFYDHYFFSFDIEGAVEKYNSVIDSPDGRLSLLTSEMCFDRLCDLDRETADIPAIIEAAKGNFHLKHPDKVGFPEIEINKIIESDLRLMFEEVKKNKGYFLMKDLKQQDLTLK